MLLAVVGGVLLSVGNLATQYALAFVGLPVTEVITASITVVIGMFPLSPKNASIGSTPSPRLR